MVITRRDTVLVQRSMRVGRDNATCLLQHCRVTIVLLVASGFWINERRRVDCRSFVSYISNGDYYAQRHWPDFALGCSIFP